MTRQQPRPRVRDCVTPGSPCRASGAAGPVRSRPIGASIRPVLDRGLPTTSARYCAQVAAPEQRLQAPVGLRRARHDYQGPDELRPRRWTIPGRSGPSPPATACPHESVDERAGRVTRRGMHDDPGGLVGDEQVLVLVGDPQLNLLRLDRRGHRAGRLEGDLPSPRPRACSSWPGRPVDEDAAFVNEAFGSPARADFRNVGEEPVGRSPPTSSGTRSRRVTRLPAAALAVRRDEARTPALPRRRR